MQTRLELFNETFLSLNNHLLIVHAPDLAASWCFFFVNIFSPQLKCSLVWKKLHIWPPSPQHVIQSLNVRNVRSTGFCPQHNHGQPPAFTFRHTPVWMIPFLVSL